jgi:pilus assembly protein FimV
VVRRSISIVAAFAVALAFATAAHAAGLGRLTVLSALGQPLAAEIEIVSLQPGEEDGLSARLAPTEAFEQAGVDINPALNSVRISIERRDKRPFLRVSSSQPVNEPFLDLLVELQWPSGRLVREYTFLLDPPEYRSRQQAIATTPLPPMAEKPAAPVEAQKPAAEAPAAPVEAQKPAAEAPAAPAEEQKPAAEAPAAPTPAPAAAAPAKPAANTYEVKRGDTLGTIARQHLRPGVSLNQMLVAIFRANEDAFIRGNVNLVRTGKILNIPEPEGLGSIDAEEANRLVKEHQDQWNDYRGRLAAVPARAEAAAGQREASGRIEPKPEAPKPPAPGDEVRLSKGEPSKPGAAPSRAAREDDAAARERALAEAQSRIAELERNVADQKKLLEMRNQQLAEMQKKEGAKPAPQPPVAQAPAQPPAQKAPEKPAAQKAPEKPAAEAAKPAGPPPPAPPPAASPAAPQPAKPAAEAPKPAAEAPKPAAEAPKPGAEAPKPAAEAPKPAPAPAKPAAKKAPPPPEPSLLDEFLDNPMYLGLLALLVILLVLYGAWTWRRKKKAQAKFQDSVLGAAAASGGGSLGEPTSSSSTTSTATHTASQAPAGMEAEEVDPIAEADVYMAYGRDAQAEEILKEALQKDSSRVPVHAKLLEIYAHRKDTRAFEQTALKLKNLTKGAGPEWEKAAALGRSIDSGNGLYGAASEGTAAAAPVAAATSAPVLDFDLGGASQTAASTPDISLDEPAKDASATGLDLELGATQTQRLPTAGDETVVPGQSNKGSGGLDFNLDLGSEEKKPEASKPASAPASEPSGLDFDLNLDLDKQPEPPKAEPTKVDLASISLDLDNIPGEANAGTKPSTDPKWQEVATKLDLAKAYEEMGDKDGARELLKEVMKDGDAAQRGSAEQLLGKLG